MKRLRESRIDIRKLSGVKIAVIGKGTGAKLEKAGLYADIMPEIQQRGSWKYALGHSYLCGQASYSTLFGGVSGAC